jgi:hypothetical protein
MPSQPAPALPSLEADLLATNLTFSPPRPKSEMTHTEDSSESTTVVMPSLPIAPLFSPPPAKLRTRRRAGNAENQRDGNILQSPLPDNKIGINVDKSGTPRRPLLSGETPSAKKPLNSSGFLSPLSKPLVPNFGFHRALYVVLSLLCCL